jgi:uncharacterized membrane protein
MSERAFPVRTLLFVSLAVNLLAIGGIAGAFLSGARLQQPAPEPEPTALVERLPGPRAFMAALPPETRVKMRQELAASWRESRETRQAAAQARRDAFEVVEAQPFDAARVKEAFARMRAADQATLGVFHDNLIDVFAGMEEGERRMAIEALRSATPARRASVLPDGEVAPAAGGAIVPGDGTLREKMRERWRERRQQRLQQQPQQAAPATP